MRDWYSTDLDQSVIYLGDARYVPGRPRYRECAGKMQERYRGGTGTVQGRYKESKRKVQERYRGCAGEVQGMYREGAGDVQ